MEVDMGHELGFILRYKPTQLSCVTTGSDRQCFYLLGFNYRTGGHGTCSKSHPEGIYRRYIQTWETWDLVASLLYGDPSQCLAQGHLQSLPHLASHRG